MWVKTWSHFSIKVMLGYHLFLISLFLFSSLMKCYISCKFNKKWTCYRLHVLWERNCMIITSWFERRNEKWRWVIEKLCPQWMVKTFYITKYIYKFLKKICNRCFISIRFCLNVSYREHVVIIRNVWEIWCFKCWIMKINLGAGDLWHGR